MTNSLSLAMNDDRVDRLIFLDQTRISVRSRFVGQQIDLKPLSSGALATNPLVINAGESGCAVLFSYGAVVTFGLSTIEEAAFLTYLSPFVQDSFETPELESAELKKQPQGIERIENDVLMVTEFTLARIQVVADVFAKCVVLSHYEKRTTRSFDQIEPFARSLQNTTWGQRDINALLRQLGNTLSIEHKIVGRVEIVDKPDLLWEYPDLDRLYLRLENEYEIRDRHLALERKLSLVARTAETAIDLLQHKISLRVEWYVVLLIVIEILLSVYDLIART